MDDDLLDEPEAECGYEWSDGWVTQWDPHVCYLNADHLTMIHRCRCDAWTTRQEGDNDDGEGT